MDLAWNNHVNATVHMLDPASIDQAVSNILNGLIDHVEDDDDDDDDDVEDDASIDYDTAKIVHDTHDFPPVVQMSHDSNDPSKGYLLGGAREVQYYTCIGCGTLSTGTESTPLSIAEVVEMFERALHAHGTTRPAPVFLIDKLCKSGYLHYSDFELGPTTNIIQNVLSNLLSSINLLDQRYAKMKRTLSSSSHDVNISSTMINDIKETIQPNEALAEKLDDILKKINELTEYVRTNLDTWATNLNDQDTDSCGIYCVPPTRSSARKGFKQKKETASSCFRSCKRGSECPLNALCTIASTSSGITTTTQGSQTLEDMALLDIQKVLAGVVTFNPDETFLSKKYSCFVCKVKYTKVSVVAKEPLRQNVLIGVGLSYLCGLCTSFPESVVVVQDDLDFCLSCVEKSLIEVNCKLQTQDTSTLLCCYKELVLQGAPAPGNLSNKRPSPNMNTHNPVLLHEMKLYIFEECIKYGFVALEQLQEKFYSRLPMKHWQDKLSTFLRACVLTQLIDGISDVRYGVDCVGSRKRPYEHNFGGKGGIFYQGPRWLTYDVLSKDDKIYQTIGLKMLEELEVYIDINEKVAANPALSSVLFNEPINISGMACFHGPKDALDRIQKHSPVIETGDLEQGIGTWIDGTTKLPLNTFPQALIDEFQIEGPICPTWTKLLTPFFENFKRHADVYPSLQNNLNNLAFLASSSNDSCFFGTKVNTEALLYIQNIDNRLRFGRNGGAICMSRESFYRMRKKEREIHKQPYMISHIIQKEKRLTSPYKCPTDQIWIILEALRKDETRYLSLNFEERIYYVDILVIIMDNLNKLIGNELSGKRIMQNLISMIMVVKPVCFSINMMIDIVENERGNPTGLLFPVEKVKLGMDSFGPNHDYDMGTGSSNSKFQDMFKDDITLAKQVKLEAWLQFVEFCTMNELSVQYAVTELESMMCLDMQKVNFTTEECLEAFHAAVSGNTMQYREHYRRESNVQSVKEGTRRHPMVRYLQLSEHDSNATMPYGVSTKAR